MSCHSNKIVRVTYPKNCCPEVDDSQQLIYPGPALPCIDVQTNQTFNNAVKELDTLLCNAIQELFECKQICLSVGLETGEVSLTIQSTGVVNGKPSYENISIGELNTVDIKWSNTNNEWEFYFDDELVYTLDSECYFPIPDANNWVCVADAETCLQIISISTYEGVCTTTTTTTIPPSSICFTHTGEGFPVVSCNVSPEPGLVNGKLYYKAVNDDCVTQYTLSSPYYVWFSTSGTYTNQWVMSPLYNTTNANSYLPVSSSANYPIGNWIIINTTENFVSNSALNCPTTTTTTTAVSLCLTLLDLMGDESANNYYSHSPTTISFVNGQPAYNYTTDFGPFVIFWNDDNERWEVRTSVSDPTLIAYLNIPYTPPTIASPEGLFVTNVLSDTEGWIIPSEDLEPVIYSTRLGNCCGCFGIQYGSLNAYEGTYVNCEDETVEWLIPEIGVPFVGVCTSSPQTVTWDLGIEFLPNGFSYIPGNESCFCDTTPIVDFCSCALCIEFPGPDLIPSPISYIGTQYGIINGRPWFRFSTSSCIKWNNLLSRWEIYTNCDDPLSLYAYLTNDLLLPIGSGWVCAPGADCANTLGLPTITIGNCP